MRIAQWGYGNEVVQSEDEFFRLVIDDCWIQRGLLGAIGNAKGETISAAALGNAEPDSLADLSPGLLTDWNSNQVQPLITAYVCLS